MALGGELEALLLGDFAQVAEIEFVAHEDHDCIRAAALVEESEPGVEAGEGEGVGDIVDQDCAVCIPQVGGDEAAELLLSRRIPQLQPVQMLVVTHILGQEVDPHGVLRYPPCTCCFSSNRPLMNRSMIDDFPTDMSPRNTILYFISQKLVPS